MPLTRLTLEERIRLVRYFSLYEKASAIQKAWVKDFGTDPPSRKTIAALNKKFDETGSVADLTRSGRPKTSRTEEKVALVQNALKNDPTKSIRRLSSELSINKATIHRIKQDTERQSYLKIENRKLKEKINELQRRLDILEGRKPTIKKAKATNKVPKSDKSVNPLSYVTTFPHFQPKLELLSVDDGQTVTVQHGIGPSQKTVITLLSTHDNTHHTLEIDNISEGHEVRHLTIDEDGHLQEVDQQIDNASDEMLSEMREDESGIIDEELMESEEIISGDMIQEDELDGLETQGVVGDEITKDTNCEGEDTQLLVQGITKFDVEVAAQEQDIRNCTIGTIGIPICFLTSNS